MACSHLKDGESAANRLGDCKVCHETLIAAIRGRAANISSTLCNWIEKAETRHGSKIFYSDEAEISRSKLSSIQGGMLQNSEVVGGMARGFSADFKNFEKLAGVPSSLAVVNFLEGPTICECEGLAQAVVYNALLETVTVPVFDLMFPKLKIGLGVTFDAIKQVDTEDEALVNKGDWIYIVTDNLASFREAVVEHKEGAAGSGWNLICIETNPERTYIGFGLNDPGEAKAMTLKQIREKMQPDSWFEKGAQSSMAKLPTDVQPLNKRSSVELPSLSKAPNFAMATKKESMETPSKYSMETPSPKKIPLDREALKKQLLAPSSLLSTGPSQATNTKATVARETIKLKFYRRFAPEKIVEAAEKALKL